MATPNPTLSPEGKLDFLAELLRTAKQDELDAKKRRLEVEERILKIVGVKDEGSTAITTDHFRVTTTGRVTRSVDEKRLLAAYENDELPAPLLQRVFPVKHGVDLAQLRYCEHNEPEVFQKLCEIITSKPAKPSVSLKDAG